MCNRMWIGNQATVASNNTLIDIIQSTKHNMFTERYTKRKKNMLHPYKLLVVSRSRSPFCVCFVSFLFSVFPKCISDYTSAMIHFYCSLSFSCALFCVYVRFFFAPPLVKFYFGWKSYILCSSPSPPTPVSTLFVFRWSSFNAIFEDVQRAQRMERRNFFSFFLFFSFPFSSTNFDVD